MALILTSKKSYCLLSVLGAYPADEGCICGELALGCPTGPPSLPFRGHYFNVKAWLRHKKLVEMHHRHPH